MGLRVPFMHFFCACLQTQFGLTGYALLWKTTLRSTDQYQRH